MADPNPFDAFDPPAAAAPNPFDAFDPPKPPAAPSSNADALDPWGIGRYYGGVLSEAGKALGAGTIEGIRQASEVPGALRGQVPLKRPAFAGREAPSEDFTKPIDWSKPLDLKSAIAKLSYGLGESSPAMGAAAAVGGGTVALGGGPENPAADVAGLVTGAGTFGITSAVQALAPYYREEIARTPQDKQGAWNRAGVRAQDAGAISAASWAAFGVPVFKGPIQNLLFQAVVAQPGVAAGGREIANVREGKPLGEGVPEEAAQATIGTVVPAIGHFIAGGGGRRAGGAGDERIEPGAGEQPPPGAGGGAPPGGEPPAAPSPHLRLAAPAEEVVPERVQAAAPRAPLPDVTELHPREPNPFDAFDPPEAEPPPPRAAAPTAHAANPFDVFDPPQDKPGTARNPAKIETPGDLAAATSHVTQPTPAQAEAGNYPKAHVEVSGFPLTIETPKGGIRAGTDASGKPWSVTMPVAYGEVKGARGFDGDKLDVFVGDNPQAQTVYLMDQVHAGTDKFDEAKGFMGFDSANEARAAYEGSFSDNRGHERVGGMVPMSIPEFREFVDKSKNRAIKSPAQVIAKRREAAMPKPVKPMRLATWLKAQGGIKEYAGELHHMGAHRRPGLVNKKGMHPDEAARAAGEAGYLNPKYDENGDLERPDMNALFEALYDDLGNNPVYPMAAARRAPEQATLPGTEPITDKELAERKMQGRKGTEKAQKDTGELPLFDTNAGKQKSLFKAENELPADTSNLRDVPLSGRERAKYHGILRAMYAIARRLVPTAELRPVHSLEFLDKNGQPVAVADGVAMGRLMKVALDGNLAPTDSVGHESVHIMRNLGLFHTDEWEALEKEATRRGWHAQHHVDDHYPHADEEVTTEEAIAEEFPKGWQNGFADYPPLIRKLFLRMRSFLTQLGAAVRRIFGRKPTAAEVFDLMDRGVIGRRAEGSGSMAPRGERTGVGREEPMAAMRREPPPPPEPPEGALPEDSDLLRPLRGSSLERDIAEGRPLPEAAYQPLKGARVLNQAEAPVIRPLVLAAQDFRSSHYWTALRVRDDLISTLRHDYARRVKGYADADPKDLKPIHAALELARLQSLDLAEEATLAPRGLLVLQNTNNQEAQLSRPGDTVRLTPAQNKIVLEELVPTFKKVWDDVIAGVARKHGYDGDTSPEGIERAIERSDPGTANRKSLERIQGLLNAVRFAARVGYVPFKRFGQYYITASPKIGTDMESLGGFPERSWFQLVDTSRERVNQLGGWRNDAEVPKSAQAAVAAVKARFPADKFDVRHGHFENTRDQIRTLDIPAIEKLLMLLDVDEGTEDLVEKIRDQFYEELKSGFRREARNTPGYDPDFRHAIGAYLNGVASHVANLVHGDAVERAKRMYIDNHPVPSIRKFWKDYDASEEGKKFQGLMSPVMREVRQIGFLETMAGNVFSMMKMFLHGPQMGAFLMTPGHPFAPMGAIFGSVGRDILLGSTRGAIAFDLDKGFHLNLRQIAYGRPLDERRAIYAARDIGLFHSDIEDFMRGSMQTTEQKIAQRDSFWQRANRILGSNIGLMDQTVRMTEFLGAFRLAKNPAKAQQIIDYWSGHSETFNRAMAGGFTPEKFARWFVQEMVGSFDPKNRPQFMRGQIGATFAQFKTFVLNLLANQWRFMRTMGPEGKLAVAQMIGLLVVLAGTQGIPGVQDVEWLIEKALQAAGYKNANIEDWLRTMLEQSPVGKIGADAVLHGLPRMFNEDWSSLGLGNEFSKIAGEGNPLNLLGTPGVIANKAQGAYDRWYHGQPLGAIAEALPAFARNPMRGLVVDPNEGIQTRKGKMLVKPGDVSLSTKISETLGIPSAQRAQAYEKLGEDYRQGWPTGDPLADIARGINARTRKAFGEQYGSIQDQVQAGDLAGARTRLRSLGVKPGSVNYVIRRMEHPEMAGRGRAFNRAYQMGTPEEKARMDQLRNQPPPPTAQPNPFDAFDPPPAHQ